jgi:hypothetical protein
MYSFVLLMMGGSTAKKCRAIYRDKWMEKTLHVVGCEFEIFLVLLATHRRTNFKHKLTF